MSISNLFILSLRGDSIIYRDFRKNIKKGINEVFFRKVNESEDELPPVFNVEGVNFIFCKKNDLYFCLTTLDNPSPSYFLEILDKLMKVIKDHCGILSEESIRKNFVLVYEIIDEMIDFGIPQLSSTEQIKPFVFTEPVLVSSQKKMLEISNNVFSSKTTKSSQATTKPTSQLTDNRSTNELYLDLFEKITCLFNSNGNLINSAIDGFIQLKSYLKNRPELKLVLSEDIVVGKSMGYSSGIQIDDCNFHQCVNTRDFATQKTLFITPPDGEFVAMNYRITTDFAPPFKFYTYTEESPYKLELKIRIQSNFSEKFAAANTIVKFNVPKTTQNVYFDLGQKKLGQKAEYVANEKCCYWKITKFQGGGEFNLVTKITVSNSKAEEVRKELGPISLHFEIPSYNISKIQVKELKILTNDKNYKALKWVRNVTQANSYVVRIA